MLGWIHLAQDGQQGVLMDIDFLGYIKMGTVYSHSMLRDNIVLPSVPTPPIETTSHRTTPSSRNYNHSLLWSLQLLGQISTSIVCIGFNEVSLKMSKTV